MSEFSFQSLVLKKEKIFTLAYLNGIKEKHSKVLHIPHNVLEMADYLQPNGILNREAKFLFSARCRMVDVGENYGGHHTDMVCPLCKIERDSQEHLLVCSELDTGNTVVSEISQYGELFGKT